MKTSIFKSLFAALALFVSADSALAAPEQKLMCWETTEGVPFFLDVKPGQPGVVVSYLEEAKSRLQNSRFGLHTLWLVDGEEISVAMVDRKSGRILMAQGKGTVSLLEMDAQGKQRVQVNCEIR